MDKKEYYYRIFLNFLKENDCFDNFKNNWYKLYRYVYRGYEKEYYNLKNYLFPSSLMNRCVFYRYVINDSFRWSGTSEGGAFWKEIDDKWIKYTTSLINNDENFFLNND